MSEEITTAEETAATPQQDDTAEQILKIVDTAQSQGVFNLSEVIKGRGYPTKEATIYLDADTAFQLAELNDLMSEYVDDEILAENEAKAEELAEKIKKSAVTFVMRGVSQKIVEDVVKKTNEKYPPQAGRREATDDPDWVKYYIAALVAHNIVRAIDADGNIDERIFTAEEMLEMRELLTADSWNVLVENMQKLTLASGYFEQLTDAGFLPRS
jgi:hypothetical protein